MFGLNERKATIRSSPLMASITYKVNFDQSLFNYKIKSYEKENNVQFIF